jgi:hypothetical protein
MVDKNAPQSEGEHKRKSFTLCFNGVVEAAFLFSRFCLSRNLELREYTEEMGV